MTSLRTKAATTLAATAALSATAFAAPAQAATTPNVLMWTACSFPQSGSWGHGFTPGARLSISQTIWDTDENYVPYDAGTTWTYSVTVDANGDFDYRTNAYTSGWWWVASTGTARDAGGTLLATSPVTTDHCTIWS